MISKTDTLAMSIDDMYKSLIPVITDIYNKNKNKYSKEEFRTIVLNTIDETKRIIKDNDDFQIVFKNRLLNNLSYNTDLSGTNALDDYLREIGKYPPLSEEEEIKVFKKLKEGDPEARELFIHSNLRLVVYVAKMYMNKGLSFGDLIQEGNIGLLRAIDLFSLDKECKFSTYAFWWIKQGITRALADKSRVIRIPVHMVEAIGVYKKAYRILSDKLGREPTDEEISEETKFSLYKINEIKKQCYDVISLNAYVGEDKDAEVGDIIPSQDKEPDEETFDKVLPEELQKALFASNLTEREITVILCRFGFYNNRLYTLEEVGKMYNITRERVRQIESRAIKKLKKSKAFRNLASWYLDKDDEKKQPVFSFETKRNVPFYKLFPEYTKEGIDYVLSKLSREERLLVIGRFGMFFDEVNYTSLTDNDTNKLYNVVIPKIRKMLYAYTHHSSEPKPIYDENVYVKKKTLNNNN